MDDIYIEAVSGILKTMGHPMRLKILYILAEGECTTGEIAKKVNSTKPNLSQHLNVLRDSGVISSSREKNFIRNRLADPRIGKMLQDFQGYFQPCSIS